MVHKKKLYAKIFLAAVLAAFFIVFFTGFSDTTAIVNQTEVLKTSDLFFSYEIIKYPSSAEVLLSFKEGSDVMLGFNIDTDRLDFGTLPGNGSYSTRTVNLTNNEQQPARILLKAKGAIVPYVNFSRNDFILKEGEKTDVHITFYTLDAVEGNYTGEIDVIIKRPRVGFLSAFS